MSRTSVIKANLLRKYDTEFNFFYAKSIREIVDNQILLSTTIQYKDVSVFSEANQYLKRLYFLKNNAGRNQIFDRINMLADFYSTTILLWYQHPLMIITNTKDIFLKRLRRMKKMIASDCSSDESSSHQKNSQLQDQQSFQSSGFLESIKTKQLSSHSHDKSSNQFQESSESYLSSVYDIYQDHQKTFIEGKKLFEFQENAQGKLAQRSDFQGHKQHSNISTVKSLDHQEQSISHLIMDIDDIDKLKTLKFYNKLEQRENAFKKKAGYNKLVIELSPNLEKISKNTTDKDNHTKIRDKKPGIIITPMQYYAPEEDHDYESSLQEKYYQKMASNFNKFPKKNEFNRYRRQEYDETIRVGERYPRSSRMYGSPNHQYRNNLLHYQGHQPSPYDIKKQNIYHKQSGRETEREYIATYDSYQIGNHYSHYRQPLQCRNDHPKKIPSRIRMHTDQFEYTEPNNYIYSEDVHELDQGYYPDRNNRRSERNYQEEQPEFRNIYREQISRKVSKRSSKRQYIREKALALLQTGKSQENYRLSRPESRLRSYE